MDLESKLIRILEAREDLVPLFRRVRDLGLMDWYIAAGLIRNTVWDTLHGCNQRSPLNDIDVVYFEPQLLSWDHDESFESRLRAADSRYNWSVKNQARMHIRNGHESYRSMNDALAHWPEVCTAVGVRLNKDDTWTVIAPYGLQDLFSLVIRRSPLFEDREYFLKRIADKGWVNRWKQLTIL
jgi:hypothetical protein